MFDLACEKFIDTSKFVVHTCAHCIGYYNVQAMAGLQQLSSVQGWMYLVWIQQGLRQQVGSTNLLI